MIKITQDWITLLVCSLITVLGWIGFEVYRIWHRPTFTYPLEEQMRPLSPKLDEEALQILRSAGVPKP